MTDTNRQSQIPNEPLQVTWDDSCFLPGGLPGSTSLSRRFAPVDPDQLVESGALYVIADGEGIDGAETGRDAIEELSEAYYRHRGASPGERLREIFIETGRRIFARPPDGDGKKTAVDLLALVVVGSSLTFANAGGNRAYLVHDGQIQLITHDPTGINELLRKGFVLVEQAEEASRQRKVVQHLGESPTPDIEVIENIPVFPGDCVLLCNEFISQRIEAREDDLLTARLDPQAILDIVLEPGQPQDLTRNQVISVLLFHDGVSPEVVSETGFPPEPAEVAAAGAEREARPVIRQRRAPGNRFLPAILLGVLFLVALALTVVFSLSRQTTQRNTPLPPVPTQTQTTVLILSPTWNRATDLPLLDARPSSEVVIESLTPIPSETTPMVEATQVIPQTADYTCVWRVEQGNSLFSIIRRFGLPYSSTEEYSYFTECDLDQETCSGKKQVIESHGSIDSGWFILIPVDDETTCNAGQGNWVSIDLPEP